MTTEATTYLDDSNLVTLINARDWNALEEFLSSDAGREEAKLVDRRHGNHILHNRTVLHLSTKRCIDLICQTCPEIISTPSKDNRRETPIHIAASLTNPCNPTLMKDLLSHVKLEDGAVEVAKMKSRAELLPLHIACSWANAPAVVELLKIYPEGAKVASRGRARLPLHYVLDSPASQNNVGATITVVESIVKSLMDIHPEGATVVDMGRNLPIHIFAERNAAYATNEEDATDEESTSFSNVMNILLDANPDGPKHVNGFNRLPLHVALLSDCSTGYSKDRTLPLIRRLLSDHPESIRTTDNEGKLPLHLALGHRPFLSSSCIVELATLLLHQYPDAVKLRDNLGKLPLHYWFGPECVGEFETAVESEEFCQDWDAFAVKHLIEGYPEGCSTLAPYKNNNMDFVDVYPLNGSNVLLYLSYFPNACMAAVKQCPNALFQHFSTTYSYRYYSMRQDRREQSPFQCMIQLYLEDMFSKQTSAAAAILFTTVYPDNLSIDKAKLMDRIQQLFIAVASNAYESRPNSFSSLSLSSSSSSPAPSTSFLAAFCSLAVHGILPLEFALILMLHLHFQESGGETNQDQKNDSSSDQATSLQQWCTKDANGKTPLHYVCMSLSHPNFESSTPFNRAAPDLSLMEMRRAHRLISDADMTVLLQHIMPNDESKEDANDNKSTGPLDATAEVQERQHKKQKTVDELVDQLKTFTASRSHLEALCFVLDKHYGQTNLKAMLHVLDDNHHSPLHYLLLKTEEAPLETEEQEVAPSSTTSETTTVSVSLRRDDTLSEAENLIALTLAKARKTKRNKTFEHVLVLLSIDPTQATIPDKNGFYPFMMAAANGSGRQHSCLSSTFLLFLSLVQQQAMNWCSPV